VRYELKPYAFGQTIGKGFNLYFENFIPIVLVAMLCQIPSALYVYLNHAMTPPAVHSLNAAFLLHYLLPLIGQAMAFSFVNVVVGGFLSAYIICRVANRFLENDGVYLEDKIALRPILLRVIGLSIILGIITFVGILLCIAPGIIVALVFSMATEVLVIEKRKILESMGRSWALVKNKLGEILLIYGVMVVMIFTIDLTVSWVLSLIVHGPALEYLKLLVSAVTSPITSCVFVVVYFNLRIQNEGFNIERLVQQFSLPEAPESSLPT
jgi:hypothetical protein